MRETAYAKINLALHIRRRRDDGYHELETLFAFVDAGDGLAIREAVEDRLAIGGEFADGLSTTDNLVLEALRSMRAMGHGAIPPLAIELTKALPVAAGLGGGSADAGAMIRLLDREFAHNGDGKELVLANRHLGADVAACIVSRTRIGRGAGEELAMVDDDLAGTPVLLVNPRVPLATGPVFAGWDGEDRGHLPDGPASQIAAEGRNDLEASAIALVPQVAEVLDALRGTGATLARMSGSGATCFALYPDPDAQRDATARLAADHPGWWQMSGSLRP